MAVVPYEGHAAAAPFRLTQPEGEATRLLYERHHRKILAFCQHQLRNREEAEDATQITFMNAFRGLRRGTSPEFESAWLYKIAHNVCVSKQRTSYRRRLVEAPSDFELIEELVPAHEGDSDELFGLTSALRVLPEQQRRALLLREWQGLSYREIADELRLSQAAVETLLFRARRSLAEALTTDPTERRKRGRPRVVGAVSPAFAVLKSLLVGGGVKIAASVATVAATSVVAAPAVRRDVNAILRSDAVGRPTEPHVAPELPSKALLAPVVALPVRRPVTSVAAAPQATATKPVAKVPSAPVVHLRLVAAPRIAAPPASLHDDAPAPPHVPASAPVTPAPEAVAAPAPSEPVPAVDPPAIAPLPDVPTPVAAPAPVPGATPAKAPAPPPATTAAAPQTVTVQNVNQPAPDQTTTGDDSTPAPWTPPGKATKDWSVVTAAPSDDASQPAASPAVSTAPASSAQAPVPVVAADESSSGPAPAWTMPEKPDKPDKPVKDKGR